MEADFWFRVKNLLKKKRITLESLANATGISLSTIKGWLAKGRLPDVKEGYAIASILEVSLDFLVSGFDHDNLWLATHPDIYIDYLNLGDSANKYHRVFIAPLARDVYESRKAAGLPVYDIKDYFERNKRKPNPTEDAVPPVKPGQ